MQKLVLQFTYSFFVRWFLRIFVGVSFHNAKFLLDEEQFIIVANHNSHLDTMALMASIPSKIIHKVKPVAAIDHFGKTGWQSKMSKYFVNALLIQRKPSKDDPEKDPLNLMVKALDEGYSLIVFPEGTRGEPEVQQPMKPGIAHVLTRRPNVKYVPAYMRGMGKAMPKDDILIVPYNSSLIYGKPTNISSENTKEVMHQIENDLNELKSQTS